MLPAMIAFALDPMILFCGVVFAESGGKKQSSWWVGVPQFLERDLVLMSTQTSTGPCSRDLGTVTQQLDSDFRLRSWAHLHKTNLASQAGTIFATL